MAIISTDRTVNIGMTSQKVLEVNPRRFSALFANVSANTIYLMKGGEALSGRGVPILSNGNYEINLTNPFFGEVYALASGVASLLLITEETYAS